MVGYFIVVALTSERVPLIMSCYDADAGFRV